MNEQNNGGPAFPLSCKWDEPQFNGMTLRDYFAAKALQGIIACTPERLSCPPDGPTADRAYRYADAMLKARG